MARSASPSRGAREGELTVPRLVDAPREPVFDAITDPGQVVNGWGPNGFTHSIQVMDVRPERRVFSHASGPTFEATEILNLLTLAENAGRTTPTLRAFPIHADDEERSTFGAGRDTVRAGLGGSLDQLAVYIAATTGGPR